MGEVVWVCGWRCSQIRSGTYDLLLGTHRNGEMKVADLVDDARAVQGAGLYWVSTGSWASATELKDASRKPWKSHVVHLQKNGEFRAEDKKLTHEESI